VKKNKNKEKGSNFENKVRKTIMSGGLPTQPLDLHYGDYCVECKWTDKKGYRITKGLLEKMWGQALDMQKSPYLIIGIPRTDKEIFLLKCEITLERKDF
jgi:hypothetical protein